MSPARNQHRAALAAFAILAGIPMGCPTWRTEHKVETTHKIEAHIVLDIRKIQDEAASVENRVREGASEGSGETGPRSWLPSDPDRQYASAGLPSLAAPRPWWAVFDLASGASAAEVSPDEEAAIAGRKGRLADLNKLLDKGCAGENNKGLVELRPCDGLKEEADRKAADELIAAENSDRRTIYSGIAKRNGLKADQTGPVGEVYAAEIRKNLKKGQFFQTPSDAKLFQEFAASPLGKKLKEPKKGEWLAVP